MSFINFDSKSSLLEHRPYFVDGKKFHFSQHQAFSHSLIQYKFSPQNTYASNITVNGGILNFKLDNIKNPLMKDFIFAFKVANSDASNTNTLCSGPFILEKVSIKQQGQVKSSYSDAYQFLKTVMFADVNTNDKNLLTDSGIGNSNLTDVLILQTSSNVTLYVELNTILSNLMMFQPTVSGDLELEITIKKLISGTDETDLTFSEAYLYVNCVNISEDLQRNILKQPQLVYRNTDWMQKSYSIPSITSGSVYEVLLSSFNYNCMGMIIWLIKVGDTLANIVKTYAITELEVKNSNNLSLTNNVNYTTDALDFLMHKYYFKNSSFFHDTNVNHQIIIFGSDIQNSILNHEYNGSVHLKDAKLVFKAGATEANPMYVNIIFLVPSVIQIQNGMLNQLYT